MHLVGELYGNMVVLFTLFSFIALIKVFRDTYKIMKRDSNARKGIRYNKYDKRKKGAMKIVKRKPSPYMYANYYK